MSRSDYKAFAAGPGENVLAQDLYEELVVRTIGFQKGLLPSNQINKVLRQSSVMAAALAKMIVDATGSDLLDDGNVAALSTKLAGMISHIALTSLTAGSVYKGVWSASTNAPNLTSGVGTQGDFYKVSVAGTTNLDGVAVWAVGDTAVFSGTVWQKIPAVGSAVTSVADKIGAVTLVPADVAGLVAIASSGSGQDLLNSSMPLIKIANIAAKTMLGNDGTTPGPPVPLTNSAIKAFLQITVADVAGLSPGGTNIDFAALKGTTPLQASDFLLIDRGGNRKTTVADVASYVTPAAVAAAVAAALAAVDADVTAVHNDRLAADASATSAAASAATAGTAAVAANAARLLADADAAATATDRAATHADKLSADGDAAVAVAGASQAVASAATANAAATTAITAATAAGASRVAADADAAATAADRTATHADKLAADADATATAADRTATHSDKLAADADAAATASDRTAVHADKLATDASAAAAAASATTATTQATAASASATTATSKATLAQAWAQNPVDVPVTTGPSLYSAYHWAQKALEAAGSIVLPGAIQRLQNAALAVPGDGAWHTVPLPSQPFGDAARFNYDGANSRIVPSLTLQERLLTLLGGEFAAAAGGTVRGLRVIARDPNNLGTIQVLRESIKAPVAGAQTSIEVADITLPPQNWLIELQAMHDFAVGPTPQNINLTGAFLTVSMIRGEKGDQGPAGTLALAGFATFQPYSFVAAGGETSLVLPGGVTLTGDNQVCLFRNGVFQYGNTTTLPRTINLPAAAVAGDDFLAIIFTAATGAIGPQGKSAFTFTSANFVQPAVNATVAAAVLDTSWMAPGATAFVTNGGTYTVQSITDPTHAVLVNTGQPENTAVGALVGAPVQVSPSGVRGRQGIQGQTGEPAFTNTTTGFTQSNVGSTVVVPVASSNWMIPGATVFVDGGGGTYVIAAVPDPTHVTLQNTGQPENAAPTTVIASGALVSPSGTHGSQGTAGANGYLTGNVAVLTGTGNWPVPAGVTRGKVWGKGRGGTGANGGAANGGGGGAEGGAFIGIMAFTPGENIPYAVPAGAAATTFGSGTRLCTANQGGDGAAALGGVGGTASIGAAVQGWADTGADGDNAGSTGDLRGGNGAGKGGGRASNASANASRAGQSPGSGGGGGFGSAVTPTNGAAGFRGEIRIEY